MVGDDMKPDMALGKKYRVVQGESKVEGTIIEIDLDTLLLHERDTIMKDEKAVKVGDLVYSWELDNDKYDECEFMKIHGSETFKIIKVPPADPMTRGAVVTIEGDDEFIALRYTGAEDSPYPFLAVYTDAGHEDSCSWKEIVSRAAGRKIIVHKTVDPNEAPVKVDTYAEWVALPEDELSKYKWLDTEGDFWIIGAQSGKFEVYGAVEGPYILGNRYFPLVRGEKIG